MEPATIAIAAVTFIAWQITAGGLKEIGKDIYGKVKESLKPDEIIKLELLENNPEDKALQTEVASLLENNLKEKPEAAKQLENLLQSANNQTSFNLNRQEGSETNVNLQGNQNVTFNFNPK